MCIHVRVCVRVRVRSKTLIYSYMSCTRPHTRSQTHFHPDSSYMERQLKINYKMRTVLIDWLVLVQIKFDLLQETLLLTISIIDRFLEVSTSTSLR